MIGKVPLTICSVKGLFIFKNFWKVIKSRVFILRETKRSESILRKIMIIVLWNINFKMLKSFSSDVLAWRTNAPYEALPLLITGILKYCIVCYFNIRGAMSGKFGNAVRFLSFFSTFWKKTIAKTGSKERCNLPNNIKRRTI